MTQPPQNNYTVYAELNDGTKMGIDEWHTLNVAKKIAAKAYEARQSVVNSPVVAITIEDIDGNIIKTARFDILKGSQDV